MTRRITVSLDESLESKIREIQVAMMTNTNRSVSFSRVLNNVLKEGLKNGYPAILT